ncbi:MAG TPA: hypothetical protein VIG73_12925 [Cerasibacillus sp.]|uniref:hypothetical protein n=1 Tax=Cerasibacillus sp. TaxID=2498711 RepID=UPI002F3FFBDD
MEVFEEGIISGIGFIIAIIGLIIFGIGKQMPYIRFFFGDRSMFSQFFWGAIIFFIGLGIIYLGRLF